MKTYEEFNEHEHRQVANAIELRKFPKDKRIFNTGDV